MIHKIIIVSTALLALGAAAAAAADQARPRLKSEATITGNLVRIGDLVENSGIVAKVAIFRAPDLGSTGAVSAEAVIEAVGKHALVGLDAGDVSEVIVTRASRTIPAAIVGTAIAQALAAQYQMGPSKDITVNFDRALQAIQVELNAKGDPRVSHIAYDTGSGRFDAIISIPTGSSERGSLHLAGTALATAEVVTVVRPVERGEILKDADVLLERRPRVELTREIITDRERAVGLAARATLQPGRPIRAAELMKPALVQRGESVTLIYEVPGVRLTVRGKAGEPGAEGDVISVLNEQSKRAVQGVVVGPGRIVISTNAPRLAENTQPSQGQ